MAGFKLSGKWVVITGASSGIGAAAALAFARSGCKLLLGARRQERLADVAIQAVEAGAAAAEWHPLDVASTQSVQDFAAWAKTLAPSIHVLINNAGGAHGMDPVASGLDRDWEAMMESNVLGVLRVTRAFLPELPHDAGSSIINIGSIAGRTAYEGGAAYCAAKAGELQITRALRLELCGTGIRVCTVDPGLAETEFSLVRFKGDELRASKVYEGMKPLSGEDIAEIILWVAQQPSHINIDELLVKPVDQAAIHKVHRRTAKPTS